MATQWLRLWHEMPNDPKWRTIARHSRQPVALVLGVYVHMLVTAGQSECRGTLDRWSDEDVASALDVDEADIVAVREAMQGRVLDGDTLMGWERRQPEREETGARGGKTSTERSRERRDRQRREREQAAATGGNGMQRSATESNAPDTDTDTDKEKSNSSAATVAAEVSTPSTSLPLPAPSGSSPTRNGAIAVLLRNLEKARGIACRITSSDPRLVQWAADGVTDAQLQEAYELATAERDMSDKPKQAINVGFLQVFLDKVLNPPAVTAGTSRPRTGAAQRPWFLTASSIEAKAAELGYTPPRDVPTGIWKFDLFKLAGVTREEYERAEKDFR